LVETLRRAAQRERLDLAPGEDQVLVAAWSGLPVFPEVAGVLADLRAAGWRLGVLTNCDDDLFSNTAPTLGVVLDEVVTAEQVASYKPRLAHFAEFAQRTGATPANWVHVANSWVYDMVPACRLGLPRVWADRDHSGHDPTLATAVVEDLVGLPSVVEKALTAHTSVGA
jgi:2-haloacid dehalogenase